MSLQWLRQRERGSWVAIQFMVWVALRVGRPAARTLLYPICVYYVVFSGRARRAIRQFLHRVLGRRISWRDLFHHYHCFASTILDRFYLLAGQHHRFQVDVQGAELLTNYLNRGQGCILLGSHLGSFEIVRAIGMSRRDLEIKVLLYEENAPMIREVVRSLNPQVADTVLSVGAPDTMLQVKDCLDRGGQVGIMGDRLVQHHQTTLCKFFGTLARFPTGTMRLTSVLKAPVILFFGLYRGGNRYEVHFELFAEQVILDREHRDQQIQQWTQRYADRLEYYCRLAPDNWFNFYDFWSER